MSDLKYRLAQPVFSEQGLERALEVLRSGRLVQAEQVARFEAALCNLTGARHAIAVSSGTAALHVAYLALGLERGDLVFVPSFAWPSAANTARVVGADVVLVDVLPDTYNIDPESLRRRMTRATEDRRGRPRLIVPVHQFGLPCDMSGVTEVAGEFGVDLIEDAACALGAVMDGKAVGTAGLAGVYSFHPRKSVTTGEGGAIVTNDPAFAERCLAFRNHGQLRPFEFLAPGLNYRLTEFQAALGSSQLEMLSDLLATRRRLASAYLNELRTCPHVIVPSAPGNHTWQTFMLVLKEDVRDELITRLREDFGIETGIGSVDAHSLNLYREATSWERLPVCEMLSRRGLALPLHNGMSPADVVYCARSVIDGITALL